MCACECMCAEVAEQVWNPFSPSSSLWISGMKLRSPDLYTKWLHPRSISPAPSKYFQICNLICVRIHVCTMYVCGHICHDLYLEVRGYVSGVISLSYIGFRDGTPVARLVQQILLSIKLAHQPQTNIVKVKKKKESSISNCCYELVGERGDREGEEVRTEGEGRG